MKKLIKVVKTQYVENTIQPLLDEGYRVKSMTSENISGQFTSAGHIVIYLEKPDESNSSSK